MLLENPLLDVRGNDFLLLLGGAEEVRCGVLIAEGEVFTGATLLSIGLLLAGCAQPAATDGSSGTRAAGEYATYSWVWLHEGETEGDLTAAGRPSPTRVDPPLIYKYPPLYISTSSFH